MLHILLLILKVIGIIFAVILGILVLLVCVVLYVPVRYELHASCDGTLAGIRIKARVTWLLHLIGIRVCYEDKELAWRIRIAWKSMNSGQEEKKTIKAEVETYDEEMEELREDVEEDPKEGSGEELEEDVSERLEEGSGEGLEEAPCENLEEGSGEELEEDPGENLEEASGERLEEDTGKRLGEGSDKELEEKSGNSGKTLEDKKKQCGEALEDKEGTSGPGAEFKEEQSDSSEESEEGGKEREEGRKSVWQKITGFCQRIWQKVSGLYRKLLGIPGKLTVMIGNIRDKVKALTGKKDKVIAFLTDEVHKKAFAKAKNEIWRLLGKLRPKKVLAEIRYGFDDPSLTGKVLAGFSIAYPFLGDGVKVYPDFERKILEGQLEIAGKIRTSYFVWLLWKLVWCKEVRMTYRHVRQFKL